VKPLIALAALCLLAWTPLPRTLSQRRGQAVDVDRREVDGPPVGVTHFDNDRDVVLLQHFNADGTSAGRTRTLELQALYPVRTWTLWNGEYYLLLVAGFTPKQLYAMRIGPDGMAIDAQLEPVFISDPLFDATSIKDVLARDPRELELLHASPYAPFSLPRLVLQKLTPGRRRASR
jgi:hypothetical protein